MESFLRKNRGFLVFLGALEKAKKSLKEKPKKGRFSEFLPQTHSELVFGYIVRFGGITVTFGELTPRKSWVSGDSGRFEKG